MEYQITLSAQLAPGDWLSNVKSAPGWLRLVRHQIVGRNVRQHQQAQERQGLVNDATLHVVRLSEVCVRSNCRMTVVASALYTNEG